MTNQKRLEEYLVGNVEKKEIGYLKSDISNGKVIMLSGKWGSGKTHFWKNKIQTVLNNEEKEIPNNYISLYGKTSIQEIKNEVFLKIFKSVDSSELEEKGINLAKNTVDLISLFTKSVGIDLSKLTDKPFENLEKIFENKKLEKTVEYLNSGAIICFDDFERKSKDIDLNDLFGFITNLTIEFKSKVVIILNDDVFEGEEKKIFSNVKEKSVSKFLKYEPSIKELFETIFSDERYIILAESKDIILNTIEETGELNARIYIQVLDNLVEWIKKDNPSSSNFIIFLIFNNINFILNHYVFISKFSPIIKYDPQRGNVEGKLKKISLNIKSKIELIPSIHIENKYLNNIEQLEINLVGKDKESIFLSENLFFVKSHIMLKVMNPNTIIKSNNESESNIFNKISNFIETGILINE